MHRHRSRALIRPSSAAAAKGVRLAFVAVTIVFAADVLLGFVQFTKEPWQHRKLWEIYEYLGDRLFDTGRHAGRVDTCYDLIADTAERIAEIRASERYRPPQSSCWVVPTVPQAPCAAWESGAPHGGESDRPW